VCGEPGTDDTGTDYMKMVKIPSNYNYIAAFLTLDCNLRCSYCLNYFGGAGFKNGKLRGEDWVRGLNRIIPRDDLPVTLQGGEPSMHEDFVYIINNLKPGLKIDILTNLQFDIDEFMDKVDPERVKRDSPYASIRVSYHPETMDLNDTIEKTLKMLNAGYSIGMWGIMHPEHENTILKAKERCLEQGIDFRIKEFLGEYDGRLHGTYRYKGACERKSTKRVLCKTTELIIGPNGNICRCHGDLYGARPPIGHILDPELRIKSDFLECGNFGRCNPCDIKVKTNRFQKSGHTSVEIMEVK